MIRHLSAEELRELARAGASFGMDCRIFELDTVRDIIRALCPGAILTLYRTRALSVEQIIYLVRAKPGQVVLEPDGPPAS